MIVVVVYTMECQGVPICSAEGFQISGLRPIADERKARLAERVCLQNYSTVSPHGFDIMKLHLHFPNPSYCKLLCYPPTTGSHLAGH